MKVVPPKGITSSQEGSYTIQSEHPLCTSLVEMTSQVVDLSRGSIHRTPRLFQRQISTEIPLCIRTWMQAPFMKRTLAKTIEMPVYRRNQQRVLSTRVGREHQCIRNTGLVSPSASKPFIVPIAYQSSRVVPHPRLEASESFKLLLKPLYASGHPDVTMLEPTDGLFILAWGTMWGTLGPSPSKQTYSLFT